MEEQKKKRWTNENALENARKYCAYQERCHAEVRYKLLSHGIYGDFLEELIATLIEDNYLNEERFAIQFAGGKHRIKGWGTQKIIQELKKKQVSDYCIKAAIQNISLNEEYDKLTYILDKKIRLSDYEDTYTLKSKLIKYAVGKGYRYDDVINVLDTRFEIK